MNLLYVSILFVAEKWWSLVGDTSQYVYWHPDTSSLVEALPGFPSPPATESRTTVAVHATTWRTQKVRTRPPARELCPNTTTGTYLPPTMNSSYKFRLNYLHLLPLRGPLILFKGRGVTGTTGTQLTTPWLIWSWDGRPLRDVTCPGVSPLPRFQQVSVSTHGIQRAVLAGFLEHEQQSRAQWSVPVTYTKQRK